MEINHQKGESCEEPLGFALGVAARKLAQFYTQALAGYSLTPSTSWDTRLDRLRSLTERLMRKDNTVMKEYLTLQRKKQAF
jgi:hypothetical protein